MKKRVFIIHGWSGYPEEGWFPWVKKELESREIEATVPAMPHPDEPTINDWVNHLIGVVGTPNENTYFVGHSIGCQTIIRYLEMIDSRVGGAVFVAGFLSKLTGLETKKEEETERPWLETPIDFEKIKRTTNSFVVILSSNDSFVPLDENKRLFEEKLGARVIVVPNAGHLNQESGFTELPIVLEELLKMVD